MAVTTWVLILLVISLAILLAIVIKESQPKAARKAQVDQAINQDTSMEICEDLTPINKPKLGDLQLGDLKTDLPQIPETPWNYGENVITLLFQDPYNLYAYWETTEETYRELAKMLGPDFNQSTSVLKLFQIADGQEINQLLSQPVSDDQRSWYFHVGRPNGTFYVELGRQLPNGGYILISRSNLVATPSDKVSDIIDEDWALIDKYQKLLYQRQSLYNQGPSSEGVSSFSFYQEDKH